MKLIDKNTTEIIPGYNAILRAENNLRSKWRPALLGAYAQRRKMLDANTKTHGQPRYFIWAAVILGSILFLVGLGTACRGIVQQEEGIFLWYCCGGPLLALLGFLILGAAGFSRKSRTPPQIRRVPLHPLRSGPQQRGIYPDLKESWMEGLSGGLKEEVSDYPKYRSTSEKDHGAQGERAFIRRLREIFDDQYYVLARSMQHPKEDVDVILIGPKGIWVFEVKHWSGAIYWDDRGWRREQTYFERGGVEVTRQPEVGEPPDQQWIRAAAEVSRTLQLRVPEVLERYPDLEKVRGGIVFTQPDAVFKFQPGRPTFWGPLNFWIKTLHEVEPIVDLDRYSALLLKEALLSRHHELGPEFEERSMVAYAQGVVQETEERLDAWVKA